MNGFACKRIVRTAALLAGGCLLSAAAFADDPADDGTVPEELELTMKLMPEHAGLPDAVTKTIELPDAASASEHAGDASAKGLSTANDARENENRLAGLDTATEARERGMESGQEMAEQARENREDAGRGDPPVTPPQGPPDDLPGPPDM